MMEEHRKSMMTHQNLRNRQYLRVPFLVALLKVFIYLFIFNNFLSFKKNMQIEIIIFWIESTLLAKSDGSNMKPFILDGEKSDVKNTKDGKGKR
jgi:hypothetical protein